jgi:hypothetical protein
MPLRECFQAAAARLYDYCEYPAVRYKILFHFMDVPYDDAELTKLRPAFLSSDIVEELYQHQDVYGGWGPLQSKDYSARDKFPTSITAINRCLYIGLTMADRDILLCAHEYLEDFIKGTAREQFPKTNERVVPWNAARVCDLIESIKPYNELCDRTYFEWQYIAGRTFEDGEYSFERERAAQREVFGTRENRLVPMQTELLLRRREQIEPELEDAMLRHYGGHANRHGYIWSESPQRLPDNFVYNKTRRWFAAFNYINQVRGSALYLAGAADWLLRNRNADGLWDFGPQIKDPWGYFGYFSTNRNYRHNRVVDCSMEVLSFLGKYIKNNEVAV